MFVVTCNRHQYNAVPLRTAKVYLLSTSVITALACVVVVFMLSTPRSMPELTMPERRKLYQQFGHLRLWLCCWVHWGQVSDRSVTTHKLAVGSSIVEQLPDHHPQLGTLITYILNKSQSSTHQGFHRIYCDRELRAEYQLIAGIPCMEGCWGHNSMLLHVKFTLEPRGSRIELRPDYPVEQNMPAASPGVVLTGTI